MIYWMCFEIEVSIWLGRILFSLALRIIWNRFKCVANIIWKMLLFVKIWMLKFYIPESAWMYANNNICFIRLDHFPEDIMHESLFFGNSSDLCTTWVKSFDGFGERKVTFVEPVMSLNLAL